MPEVAKRPSPLGIGRPQWRQRMTAVRSSGWTCTGAAACLCGRPRMGSGWARPDLADLLRMGGCRRRGSPRRIGGSGTKLGRIICCSATLHNHTASSLSVFGRPGRCLTPLASPATSQTRAPPARKHRLSVIIGRLPHPPGHPQAPQPARQPAAHRSSCDTPPPPAATAPAGSHSAPHTAHQLRLADIQRRDPLDDLLTIL
jgi:hypothetical protein